MRQREADGDELLTPDEVAKRLKLPAGGKQAATAVRRLGVPLVRVLHNQWRVSRAALEKALAKATADA